MKRTIERVFRGAPQHWVGDGFHVSNYFPSATESQKRMSPFFLLDYQKPEAYTPTTRRRGVGTHPHRGFETVTIAYQGAIAHRDSAGNGGVIGPGEVQWMTAGSGILHNEFHEEEFARAGGILHMIQIWVNLPRKHKLAAPKYQALTERDHPHGRRSPDEQGRGARHLRRLRGRAGTGGDVLAGAHARPAAPAGRRGPAAHAAGTTTPRCWCWTGR